MTGGVIMGKIIEVRNLYKDTITNVAQSTDNWLSFLNSASYILNIVLMTKF